MKLDTKIYYYMMICLLILSFGGILGAFYWGDVQLRNKGNTLSELQTDVNLAQTKILALKKAQQGNEYSEEAKKLVESLLPNQKQQEKLVADILYTSSVEVGIPVASIGSINFTGGGEPSDLSGTEQLEGIAGVYSYPFTMSISNISYETLLNLLKELENNKRLIQVDNLQISPDKNNAGQLSNVGLSLKAFIKP